MKQRNNSSLKYRLLLFGFLAVMSFNRAHAQFYSVKTDALALGTGTINAEAGMTLSLQWSVHLPLYYNPWTFSGNKKMKHLTVLPGVRYWQREAYGAGFFFGANAIVSRYNFSGFLDSGYRYNGIAYGLGLSAGYSIPLFKQWNIEFELGGGAVMGSRDKYPCIRCGQKIKEESGVWFVPDKLAVSIVYLF